MVVFPVLMLFALLRAEASPPQPLNLSHFLRQENGQLYAAVSIEAGQVLGELSLDQSVSYEYAKRTALARVLQTQSDPNVGLVLLLIDAQAPCEENQDREYVFDEEEDVSSLKDHTGDF